MRTSPREIRFLRLPCQATSSRRPAIGAGGSGTRRLNRAGPQSWFFAWPLP